MQVLQRNKTKWFGHLIDLLVLNLTIFFKINLFWKIESCFKNQIIIYFFFQKSTKKIYILFSIPSNPTLNTSFANFKFWSTNICYCLLSAPQNQLKTLKNRVWFVNVFFIFSVKKKKQKFVLQNLKFRQISKSQDDIHMT